MHYRGVKIWDLCIVTNWGWVGAERMYIEGSIGGSVCIEGYVLG